MLFADFPVWTSAGRPWARNPNRTEMQAIELEGSVEVNQITPRVMNLWRSKIVRALAIAIYFGTTCCGTLFPNFFNDHDRGGLTAHLCHSIIDSHRMSLKQRHQVQSLETESWTCPSWLAIPAFLSDLGGRAIRSTTVNSSQKLWQSHGGGTLWRPWSGLEDSFTHCVLLSLPYAASIHLRLKEGRLPRRHRPRSTFETH